MNEQRVSPSPLAGEGGLRQRRRTGEGARSLTGVARQLRARMTDAERKLWFALKDRRFATFKFRRQVPIGPYIADFLCFELRLIIEIDGGQHADSVREIERDNWLARNEFRVVRFWNNDVLQNLEGVLTSLAEQLDRTPHPSSRSRETPPSPSRGEGKKREIAR
ncbi:MAG TPA: endonuclease domain-containing protein [Bradyrhizobium sp.]|nr:endonuclease domain-containing protein [Bradyrhizobium sp.]